MVDFRRVKQSRIALAAGAALLIAVGAAGGAGAVQATRPTIEMAPTVRTPIAKLPATNGVVTVKGRVAESYGDRFVVQDESGRAMVATGREGRGTVSVGQSVMVQGRYDEGQLHASYLVDPQGAVAAVGPRGPARPGPERPGPDRPGPGGPHGPGRDGPPPPPPGCGPAPAGPGRDGVAPPPPPPPAMGAAPAAQPVAPGDRPGVPTPPAPGRVRM